MGINPAKVEYNNLNKTNWTVPNGIRMSCYSPWVFFFSFSKKNNIDSYAHLFFPPPFPSIKYTFITHAINPGIHKHLIHWMKHVSNNPMYVTSSSSTISNNF